MKHKEKREIKTFYKYLMCLGAGVASASPLVFGRLFILTWLAPSIMYCFALKEYIKGRKLRSYLFGTSFFFGFYGTGYSFVFGLDRGMFDDMPFILIISVLLLGWFLITVIQSLIAGFHFPVALYLTRGARSAKMKIATSLAAASFLSLIEIMMTKTKYAIPWVNMALTQTESTPVIQIASLFGYTGVTFLIVIVNCLIAYSAESDLIKEKRRLFAGAAAAIFSINIIFGFASSHLDAEGTETIKCAALQGNVTSREKRKATFSETDVCYSRIAGKAADFGAELLVMPETAFPYDIGRHPEVDRALSDIADENGASLIAGVFTRTEDDTLCNSIVCYDSDGVKDDICYIKRHLVPFGEYVNERSIIMRAMPFLTNFNLSGASLHHGETSTVFETDKCKVGSIICFDSLFYDSTLNCVNEGAQLLTVSTNDSWFSGTFSIQLHERHSLLRAVETSRYIVRAASSGISAVIAPDGSVVSSLQEGRSGYAAADIVLRDGFSVFSKVGPYFLPVVALIASVIIISVSNYGISKIKKR